MSKVVTSPTVSQIGSSLRPQNAAAPCFRLNAAAMLKPKKLCPQEPWSNCACLTCQLAESAVEESAVKESAPASSPASSPAISTCSLLEESAVEESAVEEAVEELPVEESAVEESAVEESALERSRRAALLEFRKRLQPIEAARARRGVPGTASHMSSSSTHEAPPQVCSEEAPWAMWMTERTAAMAAAARAAAARLDEEERQRAQAARDEAFALKAKVEADLEEKQAARDEAFVLKAKVEADLEAKQVALQKAELAPGVHALEAELALRECNEESGLETPSPSAENALPGWSYEEVEVVRDVEVRSREAEKKHTVEVRRHGGRGRKRPWRSHTHDPDDSV